MHKLFSIAVVAALVLTGCGKELKVKTVDKLTVEYGDTLDNSKLYDAKASYETSKLIRYRSMMQRKLATIH